MSEGTARVAIGTARGDTAKTTQHVPTLFAELQVDADGTLPLDADYEEMAVMLLEGDARIDDVPLQTGALNVLDGPSAVIASSSGARALLLGGARFPSPRWIGASFVASSEAKLQRYMRDAASGRWPRIERHG